MPSLGEILKANTGRYIQKRWDWDAFPANRGFAELERAQMRYIGAGGSPKVDDRETLPPGAFTCSLIYQAPGRKASTHYHQIEELFFIHRGTLTMTWQFGDETVDFELGPGDAVLNPSNRPHGFRNATSSDVVMQIMVGTAAPMAPTYTDHPGTKNAVTLRPASAARCAEVMPEIARYVARAGGVPAQRIDLDHGALLAAPYVMPHQTGAPIESSHFCFAVETLEREAVTPVYTRPVEEAFMVIDGVLDVDALDDAGASATQRLGPRDLLVVPAATPRRIANRDVGAVRFAAIVGERDAPVFGWHVLAQAQA